MDSNDQEEQRFRALASKSLESVFQSTYPELYKIIRSTTEKVENLSDDVTRELNDVGLRIQIYKNKLDTGNNFLKALVAQHASVNNILRGMIENAEKSSLGEILGKMGGLFALGGLGGAAGQYLYNEKTKTWTDKATGKELSEAEIKSKNLQPPEKAGETVERGGGSKLLKGLNIVAAAYAVYEMIQQIKELNPADPDFKKNVTKIVARTVADFGVATVAAIAGAMITAPLLGPLAIIPGLAAGYYANKYFSESVESIVDGIIDGIWPDAKKQASQKPVSGSELADLPSKNATNVSHQNHLHGFRIPGEKYSEDQKSVSKDDIVREKITFTADKMVFNGRIENKDGNKAGSLQGQDLGGSGSSAGTSLSNVGNKQDSSSGGGGGGGGGNSYSRSNPGSIGTFGPSGVESKEIPKNVTLGSGVDLSKVNKDLLSRFFQAAQEYGKPVTINSGYRSDEKQAELWARWKLGEPGIFMPAKPVNAQRVNVNGKIVDVPGGGSGSAHGSGGAIDVTQAGDMESSGVLAKSGLVRPYGQKDPVHIELSGGARQAQAETKPERQASAPTSGPSIKTASNQAEEAKRNNQRSSGDVIYNNFSRQGSNERSMPVFVPTRDVSSRDRLNNNFNSFSIQ